MAVGLGGEIGWWCPSLDDAGNGTLTLYDQVPNGNDGTLTNMELADWVADTAEGGVRALELVGTESIEIGTPAVLQPNAYTGLTISVWVKAGALGQLNALLSKGIAFGNASQADVKFGIRTGNDAIFQISNGATYIFQLTTSTLSLVAGQWHHILAVWDGTTTANGAKVYFDGSLVGSATATSTQSSVGTAQDWKIGSVVYSSNQATDDARIFSRAVTADEISKLSSRRAYTPPPINTTVPTLSITAASWSGTVGTWDSQSNGALAYAWELRDADDDSVVESGTGSPSGTGTYSGDYYLWVEATNDGGSESAASSIQTVDSGTPVSAEPLNSESRSQSTSPLATQVFTAEVADSQSRSQSTTPDATLGLSAVTLDSQSVSESTTPLATIVYAAVVNDSQSQSQSTSPAASSGTTADPRSSQSRSESTRPAATIVYVASVLGSESRSQSESPTATSGLYAAPVNSESPSQSTSPTVTIAYTAAPLDSESRSQSTSPAASRSSGGTPPRRRPSLFLEDSLFAGA